MTKKTRRYELRMPSALLKRIRMSAAIDGRYVSNWIRRVCNEAVAEAHAAIKESGAKYEEP